jgi:hypothetical protein
LKLIHRRHRFDGPAVNKFAGRSAKSLDFKRNQWALGISFAIFAGEQPVHINLWAESEFLL